ncbi:MAG TPA: alanine--tRNA ligase [Gemmatimonadales bacterium]|jgi:alanyl-tRNA synthetase|nr:alanine--tRNA ligase [Gemmatimonadales bacterium]
MRSAVIRRRFLDFFVARGHREVPSSSLEPKDDPTLLFTNAGMVQFKRTFLGQEHREYVRATTCQKCVRAGGKHNDLEQVGHTRRHHTFFEMLGNFSFGDYFKRDAIAYAWEFVTSPQHLGIEPARLSVTIHHSDQEARSLWREIAGLPDHRIYGLGDKDNFWQMGDTGPCGPCTEIYVDLEWPPQRAGTGAGKSGWEQIVSQAEFERLAEEGRLLEIWNLVFMQYDRAADGTLTPLPKPSVDTGAGLERIAAVLQGEASNFHTDLFRPLLDRAGELIGRPYDYARADDPNLDDFASYRVLADHARAVAFLLADGIYPGNEGRGYVLRRILRRAVRHAWLLGRRDPTLAPLTDVVVREMGPVYPELTAMAKYVRETTEAEERRFLETIEGGLKRLEEIFSSGAPIIQGDDAFKLYDTYGFPIDLTQIIAGERGVSVDVAGFEQALDEQRRRSRAARQPQSDAGPAVHVKKPGAWRALKRGKQKFVGYERTEADSDILAFRQDGDQVELLLRENPFYVESGGQVSDAGTVRGEGWALPVETVRKDAKGTVLGGAIERFEPTLVNARVDEPRRRNTERNHSATHLVHAALRRHLGSHVRQQGSLVTPARLRFDFSHHGPIDAEMLRTIERDVNERIWANHPVSTDQMAYRDALALGAMAFFSEKYGEVVRVVRMGDSIELCGGTHVRSTGQIGLFRFTGQGGVAAGVRRIEAVTGPEAYAALEALEARLHRVAEVLKAQPDHLARRAEQLMEERQKLETRLEDALRSGGAEAGDSEVVQVDGVQLTMAETATEDRAELGQIADRFREGKRNAVLVLFGTTGRGAIHVTLSEDLVSAGRKAGELVNRIAAVSGGKGGGRPHFASAGAGDVARLREARQATPALVAAWLGNGT